VTTKEAGRGTGLGLATVHAIVASAGGHVDCDSSPGGTTFSVFVPRVESPASRPAPDLPVQVTLSGVRVLLVEDEPAIRAMLVRQFERLGATVESAEHGRQALERAAAIGFDLLVTDMVMPGMTGLSLAFELRKRTPALLVLLMTGYSEPALLDDAASLANARLLHKPFTSHALKAVLAELLRPAGAQGGEPSNPE
jgi:two-component system, cell cycle sensor histidine kinase and response regulator CckA